MAVTVAADFLDLVYETAIAPDLWPTLIERFAGVVGGSSAAFRSYDMLTEVGTVIAVGQDAEQLDASFRAFADRNPIKSSPEKVKREADMRRCGLMTYTPSLTKNTEWLPQEEFVRTEYYNDLYRRFDIFSDVSVGLAMDGTTWTGIDVYRCERLGPFSSVDLSVVAQAIPHLARALELGRKISAQRQMGEGLAEVFDRSSYGLFLLNRVGKICHVNAAGRRMITGCAGLTVAGGRLGASDQGDTHRLNGLIEMAASKRLGGGSMALRRPSPWRPLSIIVAPIGAERAWPLHDGPAVMVCITDPETGVILPERHLRELFDLTPSEGRVAISLFEKSDPNLVAGHLGLSITTVRTHLARIYAKTRTKGQVELIRLMMQTLGAGMFLYGSDSLKY